MNELISGNKLVASLALIIISWAIRWIIVRHLSNRPSGDDDLPKRWINTAKNTINLVIVIGLIIIWLSELRFMALSIAAFAVALVVATREFIQCFLGSVYQASNRTFSVGDWIRIGNHYGEVVRSDWLSTTLLEIDLDSMTYGYTGKTLVIPNNQLVTNTVQNLNFMRHYVSHSFSITREAEHINLFNLKAPLLDKAHEYSLPFQEVAQRYSGLIEKRLGINLEGAQPDIRITTTSMGKNMLTMTIFCPTQEAINIEQRLTEDFMSLWYTELERIKAEKENKKKHQESPPQKMLGDDHEKQND